MKILHTSDLHLSQVDDERWNCLIYLLEIGKNENVDLFIISGDLFDKNIDAEFLRQHLRSIFSNNGFKIIIIPGNHDIDSYGNRDNGLYFGNDVSIIHNLEDPIEYESIRIWGFPFEAIGETIVLDKLHKIKNKLKEDKINILLYHGELLDAFFSRDEFGEEGNERYMPIKISYLKDLNFQYILAGHFHNRFDIWKTENNGYFVYSGSPISITKKEKGIRKVNLFSVGSPPNEYPLNTPHFEDITIDFDPFKDHDILNIVKSKFEALNPNAKVCLTIKGYLNCKLIAKGESEIVNEIKHMVSNKCVEENYFFEDINVILEDDLFLKFLQELDNRDYDYETKERMRELTIQAMRRIKS